MSLKIRIFAALALLAAGVGFFASSSAVAQPDKRLATRIIEETLKTSAAPKETHQRQPEVLFNTSMGEFRVRLYPEQAPKTVANFMKNIESGHYSETIFHRVIDGFMIQGGGFTADMVKKPVHGAIQNEADNGLLNEVGTIAMARTADPHSANAQFFINVNDNKNLNHRSKDAHGWGYTVFGKVVSGSPVVAAIKGVPTKTAGRLRNVPAETVVIHSITKIND